MLQKLTALADFQGAVAKAERRTLKVLDGSLPYIHVSRKYEKRFYFAAAVIVAAWLTFIVQFLRLYWYFSAATLVLGVLWGTGLAGYLVHLFFRGYRTKAVYQRLELRQKRDAKEIEKARLLSEQMAAQVAQRQAQLDGINEYHRVVYQMRLTLLRQLENGIKADVAASKEELAAEMWEPDAASTERIYERIRRDIKASKVPEYGILRRSTDGIVARVLGDRSCLPPDMSDEQLAARNLPKFQAPEPDPKTLR